MNVLPLALLALGLGTLPVPPVSPPLALIHGTVIDGTGAPARPGTTLLVRDGRIAELFADGTETLPPDARVSDLAGKTVIPGLIDAHVHLTGAADDFASYRALLAALVARGVTTVRDRAGDDRLLAYLAREAASGAIDSPDIVYAALVSGPSFFAEDPRAQAASDGEPLGEAPYMRSITAATDLPLAIAAAKGTGASGIKIYANLPAALVAGLAAEAHRQGLMVWTHAAIFPAKPSDAVRAGADSLSHSAYLAWEAAARVPQDYRRRAEADYRSIAPDDRRIVSLLDAMRERGTILDATLLPFAEEAESEPGSVAPGLVAWSAEVTALAHHRGVLVDAGSDGAGLRLDDEGHPAPGGGASVATEMALLVREAGFSPLAALHAATAVSALAAGVFADRGTIEVGKRADLVVLGADPSRDVAAVRDVVEVIKAGRVVARPGASER